MTIRQATKQDFTHAFSFIEKLWDYNVYDKETVKRVYDEIIADDKNFVFFLCDENGKYVGFCHGSFFSTFWMSGLTCYLASIITDEKCRKRGYGRMMIDHVKDIAGSRGCKAIILDSGMPRKEAHTFYERYGFEKCCYGFELLL